MYEIKIYISTIQMFGASKNFLIFLSQQGQKYSNAMSKPHMTQQDSSGKQFGCPR